MNIPRGTSVASRPKTEPKPGTVADERRIVAEAFGLWLTQILPRQCGDGGENDGAFAESDDGWYDGRHTAYTLAVLIGVRCWEREICFDREWLNDSIRRATRFLLRRQHPDGRMDLNGMYSPNEVGFSMPGLAEGYRRLSVMPGFEDVCDELRDYLLRGAEAVLMGEAYTANHRWAAACAPLAAVHSLWPDARYIAKIEDYLADGIDCDADGCWYHERSPNYNAVADEGVILMADFLGRPELLDHVMRNLQFILSCIEPNGEMNASFSHRQDRAAFNRLPISYFVARRMAQRTGDGRFTSLAHDAWRRGGRMSFMPLLFDLDNHPGPLPEERPVPEVYERFFCEPQLLRVRRHEDSLTLSADRRDHFFSAVRDQWGGPHHSDDWFHFHHGDVVIQSMHLAGAGMGNIQPAVLESAGKNVYRLGGSVAGWDHVLDFRPGSPKLNMPWDWNHDICVAWQGPEIGVRLDSRAPHSLAAVLRIWLRPGVTVEEGSVRGHLKAGEELWMKGGGEVVVRGRTHALRIKGLPVSVHQMGIRHAPAIPSRIESECGCVSVGLRFPVALDLRIVPEPV